MKELDCMNIGAVLESHSTLDLLNDNLALSTFQLENILTRWEASDVTGTFFMLPLVALNLVIRNPAISVQTRMQLLEITLHVFSRWQNCIHRLGNNSRYLCRRVP
jgi:hypothetical protein